VLLAVADFISESEKNQQYIFHSYQKMNQQVSTVTVDIPSLFSGGKKCYIKSGPPAGQVEGSHCKIP